METHEVVEMIDAITEGRNYTLEVKNERHDDDNMSIALSEDEVTFHDNFDTYVSIDNPRTAREIAGALVAWANRKEGTENPPENCNKPNIWKTSGTHRRLHHQNGECSFKVGTTNV